MIDLREKIKEQYKKLDITEVILNQINKEVKLPSIRLNSFSEIRRKEAVMEALSWEKGPDQENRIIHELYLSPDHYVVGVAKPGKEAHPDYRGCRYYTGERKGEKTNNPNDMHPFILKSGKRVGKNLTFEDMFESIEGLMRADLFGLELMGMLLFRAAFMLDHKKNTNGNWRYQPSDFIVEMLENRIPKVSGMPIRVLLHFLEVLSLNEDVKVYSLGYKDFKKDYGRINTLLTFTHLIAVLLNRRPLSKFAGSFARPPSGMAPLPKTKITEYFPLLSNDWNQTELII